MTKSELLAARAAVTALFAHPPVNAAELDSRLAGLSRDELRRALVEALESDAVPRQLDLLFLAAMRKLKPGKLKGRLSALVLDDSRPMAARELAHGALLESDRAEARRVAALLPSDVLTHLVDAPLRRATSSILSMDDPGEALLRLVQGELEQAAPALVLALELERQAHGVSAASLYGPAIEAGLLGDVAARLVDVLAEDATEESARLLERMRDDASSAELRQSCQAAALRVRTRRASPSASPRRERARTVTGRAWVTPCDGQGAFSIIAELDGKPGRDPAMVNLCIRASMDVRDGFHEPEAGRREIEEIKAHLGALSPLVEIPLADAAALAAEAVARTEAARLRIPRDARRPIAILERIETPGLPEWPVAAGALPDDAAIDAHVATRTLAAHSWFFDAGDLAPHGLRPPRARASEERRARWVEDAARTLDVPEIRARLVGMARHEARCLAWEGRPEAAAWVALGQEVESAGTGGSAFARALLRRCIGEPEAERPEGVLEIGDPVLRRSLRRDLFAHVSRPAGADLARLDFTEAALASLERAADGLPGDRRPRAEKILRAAHRAGCLAADALTGGREPLDPAEIVAALSEELGLDAADAEPLAARVAVSLESFLEQACESCEVRCLDRPMARVDAAWHAPRHPAEP